MWAKCLLFCFSGHGKANSSKLLCIRKLLKVASLIRFAKEILPCKLAHRLSFLWLFSGGMLSRTSVPLLLDRHLDSSEDVYDDFSLQGRVATSCYTLLSIAYQIHLQLPRRSEEVDTRTCLSRKQAILFLFCHALF